MAYYQGLSVIMKLVLLSLFFLVQSPIAFSSRSLHDRKACGTYHVSYQGIPIQEFFYIDHDIVNKSSFCKELRTRHENHCLITHSVRYQYCKSTFSSDKLPLESGGRFLNTVVREESKETSQEREDKNDHNSVPTPQNLAMAIPAFFILSCAFLCPCFEAKKKEIGHTVLGKESSSMDSVSSKPMNPGHKNVPPSPVRVPPSLSSYSISPQFNRVGSVHLNMSEVTKMTHNFSPSLLIGEGGFGTVYKADLPNGQVIAIKRARKEYFETLRTEFRNEVELLAKIEHRNLVKLLGYVDKGNERLIITEYVPNGTLREHLDGLRGNILDFNQRLEISIDVAHGLTYLHLYSEKQIIHRDVKSSNILLTESMRAKVADFGFARLGEDSDKSHIVTKVKGTVGYLDPEYMRTNQLTPRSDVYSFGVLLLEILTGRRPVEMKKPPDERVTIRWAFKKYNEGRFMELLDPSMSETVDEEILAKMFGLAFQCAAPTRADRPDMKSVGEQLWGIRMDYLRTGRTG